MYLGDFQYQQTIDFAFTTVNASGVPTQLAGTPVLSVYKDNNTTETTTGPTLTVDFDARTGLNHVRIATTDSFYAIRADYRVVITTGTVDGNSVVGYVVAHFSIENRPAPGVIEGSAVTGTLSTTEATSDLTGYASDAIEGRRIIWHKSAAPAGQAAIITDYNSTNGHLTFTAVTTPPVNGDPFIIV